MRMRRWMGSCATIRAAALAVGVALALTGCYSMLRHPGPGGLTDAHTEEGCYQCHSDEDRYDPAVYPWVEYYARSTSPWINYYGAPWWYDSAWQRWGDSESNSAEGPSVASGRHGWGRQPLRAAPRDSTRTRETGSPPTLIVSPAPIVSPPAPITGVSGPPADEQKPADEQQKDKPKTGQKKRSIRR